MPIPIPIGEPAYKVVPTIAREEVRDDAGQYSSFYQSADGGAQSSYGVLKPNPDGKGHFLAVSGSYSYTAPDGTPVWVSYEADDKGFRILNNAPVPGTPVAPVGPVVA